MDSAIALETSFGAKSDNKPSMSLRMHFCEYVHIQINKIGGEIEYYIAKLAHVKQNLAKRGENRGRCEFSGFVGRCDCSGVAGRCERKNSNLYCWAGSCFLIWIRISVLGYLDIVEKCIQVLDFWTHVVVIA